MKKISCAITLLQNAEQHFVCGKHNFKRRLFQNSGKRHVCFLCGGRFPQQERYLLYVYEYRRARSNDSEVGQ